jgi:hypothetical protein
VEDGKARALLFNEKKSKRKASLFGVLGAGR